MAGVGPSIRSLSDIITVNPADGASGYMLALWRAQERILEAISDIQLAQEATKARIARMAPPHGGITGEQATVKALLRQQEAEESQLRGLKSDLDAKSKEAAQTAARPSGPRAAGASGGKRKTRRRKTKSQGY